MRKGSFLADSLCAPVDCNGSFLASTQISSIALMCCQDAVYRSCAKLLARAAEGEVFMEAEMPYEE